MSQPRVIYFIEAGDVGPIKIGIATDVSTRLKSLQATNPTPLRVLAAVAGTMKDERDLHRRFASERLNGEWFRGDGEVRAFTLSLAAMPVAESVVAVQRKPTSPKQPKAAKPKKTPRVKRQPSRPHITPEEWQALFYVNEDGIYRSARAEELIRVENERRKYHGLRPY